MGILLAAVTATAILLALGGSKKRKRANCYTEETLALFKAIQSGTIGPAEPVLLAWPTMPVYVNASAWAAWQAYQALEAAPSAADFARAGPSDALPPAQPLVSIYLEETITTLAANGEAGAAEWLWAMEMCRSGAPVPAPTPELVYQQVA